MIKCNNERVVLEGTYGDLLLEVAGACQALHEIHLKRTGEDRGTEILETVAFALCSREEKERVLKAKINELKKLTEGEKNDIRTFCYEYERSGKRGRRMRERNSTTVNGGIGFTGLLTIVFIILKLLGFITWSWVWVLAPIWIVAILVVLLLVVLIILDRR